MAQIGSLLASTNQTFNLDFLPSVMVIENVSTDLPVTNLSVVTGGVQLMSVTSAARLQALAKFQNGGLLGTTVAVSQSLALALGRVNKQTTINATNGEPTTPAVYVASGNKSTIARQATETSINASANGSFSNFEALFFLPVNVIRAQINFSNGFSDEFTTDELVALYAREAVTDTDGLLSGHVCIPGAQIDRVTLFNGSGGSTVVLMSSYTEL